MEMGGEGLIREVRMNGFGMGMGPGFLVQGGSLE
jgi:hypothetical protein